MDFQKVHGLGNDFVLIDSLGRRQNLPADLGELARRICDRHRGIGADGVVILSRGKKADVQMRIFNPDGSEAQMCGNAARCAAKYLYEQRLVQDWEFSVETLAGIIVPQIIFEKGRVAGVRVDMGEPRLERGRIPMLGETPGWVLREPLMVGDLVFHVTALSMGNPHCVIFVPDTDQVLLAETGPLLENHPAFPQRTNVEFVQVINPRELKMRVWERGAGQTLACGTGACAAAVAGSMNGFTERKVVVHLLLGSLFIEWASDNHVYMTGPAEEVFTGSFPEEAKE